MKEDKFSSCVGAVVSLLAVVIIGTIANGWALATVWNWFIPPIFGLTSLTIMKAIGVATVLELFTGTNRTKKSESISGDTVGELIIKALAVSVATPILSVAIAWVVFQFAF